MNRLASLSLAQARALAFAALVAALLLVVALPAAAVERHTITLRSGTIDTTEFDGSAAASADAPDPSLQLVQFDGPVTDEQLRRLHAETAAVFTYLPRNAFLVRLDETRHGVVDAALLERLDARWIGPFRAEYKISPEVASVGGADAASSGVSTARRPVLLHLTPDRDVHRVVERVEALLGREVVGFAQRSFFSRVRVLVTDTELAALRAGLAEIDEVVWIEKERRRELKNDTTIWVGQSGLDGGQSTPVFDAGLLGAGQIVGVLDTGIDIDSCFFRDPAEDPALNLCDSASVATNPDHRKVIAVNFLWTNDCDGAFIADDEWDSQGHGSHVAGTVAGDDLSQLGVHNGSDGMAPQAKLVVQDCGYQPDDCADCPGIGACPVVDLNPVFQQAYDQGARIHTNSWGDEENEPNFGEYTAGSQDADEFMWNHKDFLLFFAAGNNGGSSGSVDSPSTAKSVVSVGSTQRGSSADTISGFSSWGPTDDGRIKPDITNPGSNISSARSDFSVSTNNCTTNNSSGTSMATPGAAGFGALVRQYFMDGYYPTGTEQAADAFTPSAALVKATLINSGTQMANQGTIPNDSQGWGRVLLDSALHFDGDGRALFVHDEPAGFAAGLAGATSTSFDLVVDAGEPLEVTLAWTDFPAAVGADPALVNDLDLEVVGPSGTFLGNVFAGGASVTGGSADRLNTVENVLLADPAPGVYTLTVRAFNVPSGPQPWALVASGATVAPCAGAADLIGLGESAMVTPTSGDGDDFLDNCEAATIDFVISNRGGTAATNPRIVSVSSSSHPSTSFAAPSWSQPNLAGCTNASADVELLGADALTAGETLLVDVEITYDEIAPATRSVQIAVENSERDLTLVASRTWGFEVDTEGWTVDSGIFVRDDNVAGADGTSWSMRSSANLDGQCDIVVSPPVRLSATSTLELWTSYDIEDQSGGQWWDRANVSLLADGATTLVEPDGGRLYTVPNGAGNGVCGTTGESGWAATANSWATSSFSAGALGSAAVAGTSVQLDVRYGTDPAANGDGFRFDQVTLTDLLEETADAQSDACVLGAIFTSGFESGDTTEWTSVVP
ncbi:MAG: S8 family serine peptidase [Acidobacteriota bacterium]